MKQSISIIVAGLVIGLSILANGYLKTKNYYKEVDRCIAAINQNQFGKIDHSKGTREYELIWFECSKSLK